MKKVYKNQAIGNPILGTKKSLSSLNSSDVKRFFNEYYNKKNILISAVGDIDHSCLEKSFENLEFAKVRLEKKDRGFSAPPEVLNFYPGVYHLKKNLEQSHILIAYEAYSSKHPSRWALSILNNFLGTGEASKLFHLIREESGLAYNVYSYVVSYSDTGLFIIYLATNTKSVGACLSLVKEQIDAIKENSISEKELELMKSSFNNSMLMDEDSAEDKMMDISKQEIDSGERWSYENASSRINRVTSEDIARVAQDIFSRSPAILELSKSRNSSSKIKKNFTPND